MVSLNATTQPNAATKARLKEKYGQIPLSFEANVGQTDPGVDFISRGSGYTLFLTSREAVLSSAQAVVRMKFIGSETKSRATGQQELPGKVNYLIGKDQRQWRTGISTYAKVAYQNLYPGVDLVYYGNQRQLEYDFIVHPGTDPNIIALSFEGADKMKVDAQGELVLHTGGGEIRQRKPFIYQEVDGVRHEIAGSYKLKDSNSVGFQLADYDASRPLVIDPVLVYSTFIGGVNVDGGFDITVDASGNAYVIGSTQQILPSTFPTTAGAFDTTHNGSDDVFVTKLNPAGSALVYSTFLGGSDLDSGSGIAVDSTGSAYVTGVTSSPEFPTTVGAFDTTHNGDRDAWVTKLNPTGSALVYSTFLGGIDGDFGGSIAVDTSGNAYVGGNTFSSNFPTTPGAFDNTNNSIEVVDVFVTKLNPSGSALVYSTYLSASRGASHGGIALDNSGSVYVTGSTSSPDFPTTPGAFDTTINTGQDAFVTKFNPTGSALVYSTFLGGSTNESGNGIALDASGNAYVTGDTTSNNFPTTIGAFDTTFNGVFDAFVTKLNPSGSALVYSTYLGDADFDSGNGIVVDTSGSAYLTGTTASPNFPTTVDAFDTTFNGGETDVFVTQLNPSGSALAYSTFLGGSGTGQPSGVADDSGIGIALDISGGIYVTGETRSANFPTTAGAFDTMHNGVSDAFVTKFSTTTGVAATLTLNPPAATNPVDTEHCVTATVEDASGNPVVGVVVRFEVSGAVDTTGSLTTNASGDAAFCYVGPPLPGADAISAFADGDTDNVQDPGEPIDVAEKTWVLPLSTPRCEITNGGWIIASNGDRASFGGSAKANASGETQGQETYVDHGPAQRLNFHSINVLAIVCDGSTRASIFGQATINGTGPFNFRINVQDLGKGQDTYWLLTDSYDSGEQVLGGGNIQIRRK